MTKDKVDLSTGDVKGNALFAVISSSSSPLGTRPRHIARFSDIGCRVCRFGRLTSGLCKENCPGKDKREAEEQEAAAKRKAGWV